MGSTSGSRSYLGYCQDTQVFTHPSSIVIIRNFGWGSCQGFVRSKSKKNEKNMFDTLKEAKRAFPGFFNLLNIRYCIIPLAQCAHGRGDPLLGYLEALQFTSSEVQNFLALQCLHDAWLS